MSVLPTARNNKRRIQQSLERAEDDMEKYIEDFHGFSFPPATPTRQFSAGWRIY